MKRLMIVAGFVASVAMSEVALAKRGIAYFDLTTATCDAILRSRKPLDWFKRDIAHNDDRGKQLIAQRLAAYFNVLSLRGVKL